MSNFFVFSHASGSDNIGPNIRWFNFGKELVRLGHRVSIVGSQRFHKYNVDVVFSGLLDEKNECGVRLIHLWNFKYSSNVAKVLNQLFYAFGAVLFIAVRYKALRHADYIICSSPHPFAIFPSLLAKWVSGGDLIYDVRDVWPNVLIELSGVSPLNPYIYMVSVADYLARRFSKRIICVKEGDCEFFSEVGKGSVPTQYIPNGIDLNSAELEKKSLSIADIDNQRFTVGYIGSLGDYYFFDDLLMLASLSANEGLPIDFKIIGSGSQAASLFAAVSDLGLDNVQISGAIRKVDVMAAIDGFDIAYLGLKDIASNRRGISCNKIFEYMLAAKPILATYVSHFDPILSSKGGFTYSHGSVDEMYSQLKLLFQEQALTQKIGISGRDYVIKNHGFEKLTCDLLAGLSEN